MHSLLQSSALGRGVSSRAAGAKSKKALTTIGGISRLDEAKLRAKAKHYQRLQWKTPIFTAKRVRYEKLANVYFKAANQARKVKKSPIFRHGTPEQLWVKPNRRRLVDFYGVLIGASGIQSDAINAIAAGAKAGPVFLHGEYRKSILGALMALHQAGDPKVTRAKLDRLRAPFVDVSLEATRALIAAIGKRGGKLEDAYHHAVKRIARYGPKMRALAWSNRELLWLKDVAGFETVAGLAGTVLFFFPPIGTTVSAAIAAHSMIALAITSVLSMKAQMVAKKSIGGAKREFRRKHADAGKGVDERLLDPVEAPTRAGAFFLEGVGWVWWAAGAVLVVGSAVVMTSSRRPE